MLNSKENQVKIEGILSEVDIKENTYEKNGSMVKALSGQIKIRVDQTLPSGEQQSLEIPVHMFANEMTNKGTLNPAYESIRRIRDEFKSIAAVGIEEADRVRITNGEIGMNEYYGQDGVLHSYPRIRASFVNKTKKEECVPCATFSVIFCVGSKGFEVDKDGVEIPNRYKIGGVLPRYGGKVDIVNFYATNPNVIDAISNYWNVGDTVKANGRLNFTSSTVTEVIEVDFGEPQKKSRTVNISDLILTGGSSSPLEGEFAFDTAEIQAALKVRQSDLEAMKNKTKAKPTSNTTDFKKLGF